MERRRPGRRPVEMLRAAEALGGMDILKAFLRKRDLARMTYSAIASDLDKATGVRVTYKTIQNWLRLIARDGGQFSENTNHETLA